MDLRRISTTGSLPVTLAEAKLHCRVDNSDEDTAISDLIVSASEYVADIAWISLQKTTWELVLPCFPGGGLSALRLDPATLALFPGVAERRGVRHPAQIRLPRGPLVSIDSIAYVDADGNDGSIDEDLVQISSTDDDDLLAPTPGGSWPAVQAGNLEPVVIRYTAGYDGTTGHVAPLQAKQAIKLVVAHWYEHREAVTMNEVPAELALAVRALVRNFSRFRFDSGR